jgi:hypothetical protein
MSHFESPFKGLSAPSQAGLALSVLMTAAMVAASPSLDTSLLSSEWGLSHLADGMPTSWLAHIQEDALPVLNQKLDLVLSGLSPRAEAMLEQARLQSINFQSNAATAAQQFGSVIGEQSVRMQGSLNEFIDIAKVKSGELQEILTAQASNIEAQSSSMMQRMEMATASRLADSQTIYEQASNELTAKGSKLAEIAMVQASSIHTAASSSAAHLQSAITSQTEEIRNAVVPKLENAMAQSEQSLFSFQKHVDETLLKEGPVIRDELDRYVLSPIRLELTRETDLLKASALTTSSQLQAAWETTSVEFESIILKMSQNVADFFTDSKVAFVDGTSWIEDSVESLSSKLQTDLIAKAKEIREAEIPQAKEAMAVLKENALAKSQDLQSQTLSAMEQFERAAASHVAEARSMYAQMSEDTMARTLEAKENILYPTSHAKYDISKSSVEIRSAVKAELQQIRSILAKLGEFETPLVKEDIGSFFDRAKTSIAAATSNLHYTAPVASSQPNEATTLNLGDLAKSSGDYLREGAHKLQDITNKDPTSIKIPSGVANIQIPSPEAPTADIVVSDSLPSQYSRLQDRLMNSL